MFFSRGPNKIQNPYNTSDMYEPYLEYVNNNEGYCVDKKIFLSIINDFYKAVVNNILDGEEFIMPFQLGKIVIYKRKASNFRTVNHYIDWKKTVETGKKVYYLNEHSDGYNYSIEWERKTRLYNSNLYRFIGTRRFKRTLAKIIKNRENDYFEKPSKYRKRNDL